MTVDQAAVTRLLVAQVPDLARRSVPVPTKRLGTVESFDGARASVTLDGDASPVTIQVAVPGGVWPGQRVVVDFYPPHGALISGVLSGSVIGELIWTSTVTVASNVAGSTSPAAWVLGSPVLGVWTDTAGVLTCQLDGWWAVGLHGTFATSGAGTVRAIMVQSSGVAVDIAASEQFAAPGGTPTAGFGLALDAGTIVRFAAGDTLTTLARQDSGGNLDVDLRLHLRWVGSAAG